MKSSAHVLSLVDEAPEQRSSNNCLFPLGMYSNFEESLRIDFDAARYLSDETAIAEYMAAMLETGDTDMLLLALSDVARARGMTQLAKATGLGRESLYKALSPGAQPRFDTVVKVARALGVRITAIAAA